MSPASRRRDPVLLAGIALAVVGVVLVELRLWLWGALALVLAAVVLALSTEAGRRYTRRAAGAAGARASVHGRVVGARSRGQVELFRLRRELAELQAERGAAYQELGRATHQGDEAAASGATAKLDDLLPRIEAKEAEIATLVTAMDERVRRAQAKA
jgi:hypothetical protein